MAEKKTTTTPAKKKPSKRKNSAKTKLGNTTSSDSELSRQQIIEAALEHADQVGWSHSTLGPLADYMGVEVNEIRKYFPDADAIANAWLTQAQDAMLEAKPAGFDDLPVRERIKLLMLRWFDHLAPHREVAAQILCAKLHYPHAHHWVPAIFSLSRTIQLLRDAAGLHARGRRAQVEEIGLTTLFLVTLKGWCRDNSPDQERTRWTLDRRLH